MSSIRLDPLHSSRRRIEILPCSKCARPECGRLAWSLPNPVMKSAPSSARNARPLGVLQLRCRQRRRAGSYLASRWVRLFGQPSLAGQHRVAARWIHGGCQILTKSGLIVRGNASAEELQNRIRCAASYASEQRRILVRINIVGAGMFWTRNALASHVGHNASWECPQRRRKHSARHVRLTGTRIPQGTEQGDSAATVIRTERAALAPRGDPPIAQDRAEEIAEIIMAAPRG